MIFSDFRANHAIDSKAGREVRQAWRLSLARFLFLLEKGEPLRLPRTPSPRKAKRMIPVCREAQDQLAYVGSLDWKTLFVTTLIELV